MSDDNVSNDNVKNACERFEEDLVTLADGELSGEAKEKLEAHLADCEACRAVFADLKGLGDELKAGWPAEAPSEAWEARTERFIRRQAEVEQKKTTQGSKDEAGRGWWGFLLHPVFAVSFGLAVLVVGFMSLKGDGLRSMFSAHSQALSGNEGPTAALEYKEEAVASFGQGGSAVNINRGRVNGTDRYTHAGGVNFKSPKRDKDSRRPGQWDRSRGLDTSAGVDMLRGGKGRGGRAGIGPGGLLGGRSSYSHDPAPEPARMNANAYFKSTYRAGGGDRERLEQLVAAGVLVDGKQLKLGSLTRGYAQHFTVPGRSALGINAGLDRGKILASAGGEVFLQVGIQAAKREMNKRPPLNMALVIDRSGSMSSGGKMGAARKAARRFVDGLREDDQVTLIAYDTRVESISARGDQKKRLRGFIEGLKPRGSTNIHEALDRAYRAVAKTSRPGSINTVLLLSDGLPTAGNTSPSAIVAQARVAAEAGISTSTVGMGLDYNDGLMMGVSEKGQGHYHFVKDAGSVEGIFKAEIASLNRVVARALKLRIVLA
ncbi:MAG: VWA domain-containing protein, partial [Deltaproteobacteria bacterium]|nr:VWA domain-containing protein [Deltaproteobacteria bacterium]